jgi:hypothetical protein
MLVRQKRSHFGYGLVQQSLTLFHSFCLSFYKAETKPGRLTRIRQLFTNLLRTVRKADAKVPVEFETLAATPSLQEPFTIQGNRITYDASAVVPTKPVEFRRRPLKVPSQPRPQSEAMMLAARYAAIESVEERAFQILVDLGMVEIHN